MKSENYIKCYEVLRDEIGKLCKLNCEILDMEKGKRKTKAQRALIEREKSNLALRKEHFRGMCDMANLTGDFFSGLTGLSDIDSEFGWFFQ